VEACGRCNSPGKVAVRWHDITRQISLDLPPTMFAGDTRAAFRLLKCRCGYSSASQVTALRAHEQGAPAIWQIRFLMPAQTTNSFCSFFRAVFSTKNRHLFALFLFCFPEGLAINDEIKKVPLRFECAIGVLHSSTNEGLEFKKGSHLDWPNRRSQYNP
jgi:hypothetical protein